MDTTGITLPIDTSNKIWIQNKDDIIIGNKYTVFKEWSRSTFNPEQRLFHMFTAKLSRISSGENLAISEDDETIYNFEEFKVYYGNNSACSSIQSVVPMYASYASYSPDVNELELYSCYFFSDYRKPLPKTVMESIELYPFHKTKDELTKENQNICRYIEVFDTTIY
jgi:hypothetical protein